MSGRVSVTLNVPIELYNRIEKLTKELWPEQKKKAPRWIALIENGMAVLDAAKTERETGQPSACARCDGVFVE